MEQFSQLDLESKVKFESERTDGDSSGAIHNTTRKAMWAKARRSSLGYMHGLDGGTWDAHGLREQVKKQSFDLGINKMANRMN